MTCEEQLEKWVAGESIHNGDRGADDSECCPDFSCCQPDLLWPEDLRKKFRDGDDDTRNAMCGMALSAAIEKMGKGKDVYIAGEHRD